MAECAGARRDRHSGTRQVAREVSTDAPVSTRRHQFLLMLRQEIVCRSFSVADPAHFIEIILYGLISGHTFGCTTEALEKTPYR